MKKIIVTLWTIMSFNISANAAIDQKNGEGRYVLKGGASVSISVETGWQRNGLIPVLVDFQGLNLSLWMDSEGRVFYNPRLGSGKIKMKKALRRELFRLDMVSGQLQAGDRILTGRVYEQNALRTRLRLDNLILAIQLDIQKGQAALDLDGIIITVRLRLGKEADDVRELKIGEQRYGGEKRLFLDERQGCLFYEESRVRPAMYTRQSKKACWAESQKK